MKDKNLRKILWGHWYTQDKEQGGPDLLINRGQWRIDVGVGVIVHLLKKIDSLESKIVLLEHRMVALETKKKKH